MLYDADRHYNVGPWSPVPLFQVGKMVTGTHLNDYVRDNQAELSLHTHSGGSGSGTAAIGPMTLMTFIDAAAPAAPGGTLTRLYTTTGTAYMIAGAGAGRALYSTDHTHTG